MAVQLGLSGSNDLGLGGRRFGDRRANPRATRERRHRDRRRARLRRWIVTSLALALPHHVKHNALTLSSVPLVSTTIDSVMAVPPAQAYEGIIREAAALYRVDSSLIRSVMQAESAFDPSAVSRAGAMGLMQLMPAIAEAFDVVDPFDPRENVMAGTRLLRELLDQHRGNLRLTIASYNAGPTAVAHYRAVPPFRETQRYVKRVTGLIADARATESSDDDEGTRD
jgi:soluble lytic murein transglycosylase-like protein